MTVQRWVGLNEIAMLALNAAHEMETSPLDAIAFRALLAQAFHVGWVRDDALMIALDHQANYASQNFKWFQKRYQRFIYVDRVMVSHQARGQGLARRLYEELFAKASMDGHEVVCCEINVDPPNRASDVFHAEMRFEELDRVRLLNGKKTVRYMLRSLS